MRTLLLLCALAATLALTPDEIQQFKARDVTEQNTGLKGSVTVTTAADTITIVSNGIPDHATAVYPNRHNPNSIVAQNFRFTLPKAPQVASQTSCLPMGPVGVAINGVPIFNPFTIECLDAKENEVFDECDGHPAPNGQYHYHIHPDCVFDGTSSHSQIVGVAADGFPIYGPVDDDGTVLTNADLDECHGRMKNGVYRYHVTNEYPYFMACFKGTVRSDSGINAGRCQCNVDSVVSTGTQTDLAGTGTGTNTGTDTGGIINPHPDPLFPGGPHHPPPGGNHHHPPPRNAVPDNQLTYQDFLQWQQQQHQHQQTVQQQPLADNTATAADQPLTLYQIWQQHQPTCDEWQQQQWHQFERVFLQFQQQQHALHQAAAGGDAAADQLLQQMAGQTKKQPFRPRAPVHV
uniref:YHYH domain-containing protein n=1 Tax=Branchiostoma floridae TaxID=7739 RepID=C3Z119_BRAFL|eukprot:XP_002597706.1 hypothetical protein BRAFLDRAFT_121667 [Branchiostoma floridae]